MGGAMTDPGAPVVRLEGLSHRYRGITALDGITLDIPAGRIIGLIGPDGVGKSSLLGVLAGAKRSRRAGSRCWAATWPMRAIAAAICPRIAYMPQGLGDYPKSRQGVIALQIRDSAVSLNGSGVSGGSGTRRNSQSGFPNSHGIGNSDAAWSA